MDSIQEPGEHKGLCVGAKPSFSHPSSDDNKKCPTHKVILRNKLNNMCNPYLSAWHIVGSLKLAHG